MNNEFILDYLTANDGSVSEYSLLGYIQTEQPEFFDSLSENPSLYKKHFYLFNQLYQLSDQLKPSGRFIEISLLNIQIIANKEVGEGLAEIDQLRSFYLDEKNMYLSDQEVSEMLSHFWERFLAIDQKSEAIKCLGLEKEDKLNKKMITKRFNQLALKHHPDRGGKQQDFLEIKNAYTSLKKLF